MFEPRSALDDLLELLGIPGISGEERAVAGIIRGKLLALGFPPDVMAEDHTQSQSEYGGQTGNLIVRLDGHGRGERRMLSAHMDTVAACVGAQPRVQGDTIVNAAPGKALGGDNRAGCAVLLHAARVLAARKREHGPVTLVFFVQEEVGLVGARGLEIKLLGSPAPSQAFNFDGGNPAEIVTKVTGTERLVILLQGVAAHAGSHPEQGVSTAIVAARALAELDQAGWHGRIERPEGKGSANLGVLRGGANSNVVMPELYALAEARSHDQTFRQRILDIWKEAFTRAAATVRNTQGLCAEVRFEKGPWYEPYALPEDASTVQTALAAVRAQGLPAYCASNDGGMDANWIVSHGIPAVTLGCGQRSVHTPAERLELQPFAHACRIAEALVSF